MKHEACNMKHHKSGTVHTHSFFKVFHVPRRGFSLVEAMIYVAILAVSFTVVVSSLLIMSRSYSSSVLTRAIRVSAVSGMETILRETRRASDITEASSVLGSHPGVFVLAGTDEV